MTTCLLAARGRATIEQAKGILMARHAIDADKAFERLRGHSQHNGRKLVDVAEAVVETHLPLLPPIPPPSAQAVGPHSAEEEGSPQPSSLPPR